MGDPYEEYLGRSLAVSLSSSLHIAPAEGRRLSLEEGWNGLDMEPDENANASLCYT